MEFILLVPVAFSNCFALLWTTTCLVGCHGNLLSVIVAFRFSRVIHCLRICWCFSVIVVLLHNNASAARSERTETGSCPSVGTWSPSDRLRRDTDSCCELRVTVKQQRWLIWQGYLRVPLSAPIGILHLQPKPTIGRYKLSKACQTLMTNGDSACVTNFHPLHQRCQ